ncbi:MAG: DTW domain-containing protein [Neptuniibacter caesariensis]|uniref:tRNA-uridine aminocarboxypropyltransferase n=1 Tax=Neptuniibacter caesariensis TaxID=207954 RepID=A0A2G6JND6_NEPCE|nr:MAG: DTW domain-containing protein [Neptuniibacter caesariensis]
MSKPFLARGSRIERCGNCLLAKSVCICSYKLSYQAKAGFYLLMHHNEAFKPTNTGRLIEDCISGTKRFEWSRTEPSEALLMALSDPAIDPYIVFPEADDYRERMVDYTLKPGKQPVFIILDGTWRQARRMFRHSRYLDTLPVIQPRITATSQYKLRKAAVPGQLCTVEVAAEMLKLVNDQVGSEILANYFSIFNEHYKSSRMDRPVVTDSEAKQWIRAYQQLC